MSSNQIASTMQEVPESAQRRRRKPPGIPEFGLPDMNPIGDARNAAKDKVEAIGSVNPRSPGPVNVAIQAAKKLIARLFHWHVRGQVEFNEAAIRYMDRNLEAAIEQNDNLLRVARTLVDQQGQHAELDERCDRIQQWHSDLKIRVDELGQQHADLIHHWTKWRPAWEEKLTQTEIDFLHKLREIESGNRDRDATMRKMHEEYLQALSRATDQLQQRFWSELKKLKADQERLIHAELRVIRRRAADRRPSLTQERTGPAADTPLKRAPTNGDAGTIPSFDYARFEERFRGDETYVTEAQKFYLPYFQNCRSVLDVGCGRGEFLALLRDHGVPGKGVDVDMDAVAACREKKLEVEMGDLFTHLSQQSAGDFDGIFCSHVVEHLAPSRLPELFSLLAQKLSPGGVLALETPNSKCLAIFASTFYLDPTHRHPVPSSLLHFFFEEEGFGDIEVHELHPASNAFPEIAALDKLEELREFRRKFFGGLDCAVVGRKLKT